MFKHNIENHPISPHPKSLNSPKILDSQINYLSSWDLDDQEEAHYPKLLATGSPQADFKKESVPIYGSTIYGSNKKATKNGETSYESSKNRDQNDENQEQVFLDGVENMRGADVSRQRMTKQQIILQAQVIELQAKCNSLATINRKLIDRRISQQSIDHSIPSHNDISELQIQFTQIQQILKSYREQLQQYQKQISRINKHNQQQISSLNQKISALTTDLQKTEMLLIEQKVINQQLTKKNEELIIEIESVIERSNKNYCIKKQYDDYQLLSPQAGFPTDVSLLEMSNNGEYCLVELEKLVDQLARELEQERSIKKNMHEEIRKLHRELRNEQKKMQDRNQVIFELEREMLKLKKMNNFEEENYYTARDRYRSSREKMLTKSSRNSYTNSNNHRQRKSKEPVIENESRGKAYSSYYYPQSNHTSYEKKLLSKQKREISNIPIPNPIPIPNIPHKEQNQQINVNNIHSSAHINSASSQRLLLSQILGVSPINITTTTPTNNNSEYTLLLISKKILELYQETEQKNLPKIKMTIDSLEISNINRSSAKMIKNSSDLKVKAVGGVTLSDQEYFWATFQVIEQVMSKTEAIRENSQIRGLMNQLRKGSGIKGSVNQFTYLLLSINFALSRLNRAFEDARKKLDSL